MSDVLLPFFEALPPGGDIASFAGTEAELREAQVAQEEADRKAHLLLEQEEAKKRGEVLPEAPKGAKGRVKHLPSGRSGALLQALSSPSATAAPKPLGSVCPKCHGVRVDQMPSNPDGGITGYQCRTKGCRYRWAGAVALPARQTHTPFSSPSGQIPTGGTYTLRGVGAHPDKTLEQLLQEPAYRRGK